MWEYQQHFHILVQSNVKGLFQKLDHRLQPEVFLVGVLADTSNTNHFPACVEPEDDFWIHSEDFNDVREISKESIREIIEAHTACPENRRFYVSDPAQVNEYRVFMVLSLQDDIVKSYPALPRNIAQAEGFCSSTLPVSLIDAVAEEFLRYTSEELNKPNPSTPLLPDNEEVFRTAGANLARTVSFGINIPFSEHVYNLFRDCSIISSLRYEQSAGSGRILLAANDHPDIKHKVTLETPIKLKNYRAARKLLQLSFKKIMLYSDSHHIYGLAKVSKYDKLQEDLFEVRILDHHHWDLRCNGRPLMTVRYGVPSLPKLGFDEQKFRNDVTRIFKGISDSEIELLLSLVKEAEQETHGTMLLISTDAKKEAERLTSQGTPITPCLLNPKLLKNLTPIDGAILLNPDGMCYAIGTILDGKATKNGDPSRGARYNSAVRYVESSGEESCLAVIVSEDGGVKFYPDLRPSIKRSTIDEAIAQLKCQKSTNKFSVQRYRKVLNWLEEHRFYLTQADCNLLNKLVPKLEDRSQRESQSQISIAWQPLEPDPKMDKELYYENGPGRRFGLLGQILLVLKCTVGMLFRFK